MYIAIHWDGGSRPRVLDMEWQTSRRSIKVCPCIVFMGDQLSIERILLLLSMSVLSSSTEISFKKCQCVCNFVVGRRHWRLLWMQFAVLMNSQVLAMTSTTTPVTHHFSSTRRCRKPACYSCKNFHHASVLLVGMWRSQPRCRFQCKIRWTLMQMRICRAIKIAS